MRIKTLRRLIFLFIISSILISVQLYSELHVPAIKLVYIVNNFLEHYYIKFDESLPEINLETTNLCSIPSLKYDNHLALKHLDLHSKEFAPVFQTCLTNQSVNIESFVEIWNKISNTTETYLIKLNMDLVKKSFKLNNNIVCTLQRFIKEDPENKKQLTYFTEMEFDNKLNFTVSVNDTGYYYVKCVRRQSILNSLVFDYIYTVLPFNMTKLMDKRRYFRGLEEETAEPYKDFPLLKHNDFEPCFKRKEVNSQKMNVLILGLDSVSTSHFKRIFPKTFSYLNNQTERNFIFNNLNSVGSNTYPNMLALLAGMVEETIPELKIKGEIDFFRNIDKHHDILPFIWKEFEDLGYITMYQEDDPKISIFNYLKDGFKYHPTGLYNRAYNLQYYKIRSGPDKCHHTKPSYLTWLNQIEQFVTQMNTDTNRKIPYFAFNFLTEYTHDYFTIPKEFDQRLSEMFMNFEKKGFMDNTMVIVMGDHGNRIVSYSYSTEMGILERYRPFLSIRLPKAFENTKFLNNIQENQNKLVSFYDIYQTLRHFLFLNKYDAMNEDQLVCSKQFEINSHQKRTSRGISLFQLIPKTRNCSNALISNKLCNCYDKSEITEITFRNETGYSFNYAAKKILNDIIKLTDEKRHICELYNLRKNHTISLNRINLKPGKSMYYKAMIIADPGEAWFESNIFYDSKLQEIKIPSVPTRMSRYGNQSECINDSYLKNFCYCKY